MKKGRDERGTHPEGETSQINEGEGKLGKRIANQR
jgi:hypothetical protein